MKIAARESVHQENLTEAPALIFKVHREPPSLVGWYCQLVRSQDRNARRPAVHALRLARRPDSKVLNSERSEQPAVKLKRLDPIDAGAKSTHCREENVVEFAGNDD